MPFNSIQQALDSDIIHTVSSPSRAFKASTVFELQLNKSENEPPAAQNPA